METRINKRLKCKGLGVSVRAGDGENLVNLLVHNPEHTILANGKARNDVIKKFWLSLFSGQNWSKSKGGHLWVPTSQSPKEFVCDVKNRYDLEFLYGSNEAEEAMYNVFYSGSSSDLCERIKRDYSGTLPISEYIEQTSKDRNRFLDTNRPFVMLPPK